MKKSHNKNNGITLVALVVTIIILLILAGISIASLTGNGLFEKAKLAKEKQENAQIKEDVTLGEYENEINQAVVGSRDTVTLSTEEYNKLKNANVYSENEIIIGNWIDGKTLYRKVINFGALPNKTTKYVAHNIANVDTIYINYGSSYVKKNSTGDILGFNYPNSSLTGQWASGVDDTNVFLWAGSDRTGCSAYVTLEYTKLAD